MAQIDVRIASNDAGWVFEVTVTDGDGQTTHRVAVTLETYERLTGHVCPPEELVRRSFEFLLEREPKESILREFDIIVISRYFPDYERELRKRLRA